MFVAFDYLLGYLHFFITVSLSFFITIALLKKEQDVKFYCTLSAVVCFITYLPNPYSSIINLSLIFYSLVAIKKMGYWESFLFLILHTVVSWGLVNIFEFVYRTIYHLV